MAQDKQKRKIKKELDKITDTIDYKQINNAIESSGELEDFTISKQTLMNIASWALDGKTQYEIRQNLELTPSEWNYLLKICPTILIVMQHSTAYADIVVAGSLYQTAIGGHTIRRKMPMKIKEYGVDEKGRSIVVGEHVEIVEYDEVQPSNPMLLKYLAEHKLSEQFGKEKSDNSEEHRQIIDNMNDNERKIIEEMSDNDE